MPRCRPSGLCRHAAHHEASRDFACRRRIRGAHADLDVGGVTADSRAVKRGDVFVAIAGGKADGLAFCRTRDRRRRGRDRGRTGAADCRCPASVAFVRVGNARRALALIAAKILSAPAANHRRRHRHQRQDFGRGLHAADLDARSVIAPPASARSASFRRAAKLTARSRRPIRSRCIARSMRSPATASPISRSKRPRTASINTGSTACASRRRLHQHHARSSRLSSDLRGLSRRQAAAVRGVGRSRAARRSSTSITSMPTR